MLLPRKQKPDDDERLTPHVWPWKGPQREEVDRSKTGTPRFAELSKLSAKLVELSLEENQRDMTLRRPIPSNLAQASWPFLWPSRGDQRIVQPPIDKAGRPGTVARKPPVTAATHLNPRQAQGTHRELKILNFAVLRWRTTVILREITNYWTGSAVLRNLRGYWKSLQNDHRVSTFRTYVHGGLTLAAQHTDPYRQRTASLIGQWSRRSARTTQFLADRISAKVQILTHSQPSQHLKHVCRKLRMPTALAPAVFAVIKRKFAFAKRYRCRDCGRQVGFRSQPRNLMERYILPLLLMRPVRCAECFRRDYRLILTPVRECSPQAETVDHIHRNAA
jgi:hypothetical protein